MQQSAVLPPGLAREDSAAMVVGRCQAVAAWLAMYMPPRQVRLTWFWRWVRVLSKAISGASQAVMTNDIMTPAAFNMSQAMVLKRTGPNQMRKTLVA